MTTSKSNILAVVPARSGSKGIQHKNISKIKGTTLLEIAINVGLNCKLVNEVYVSTDSAKYQEIAKRVGAKSLGLRKSSLSDDSAKTVDVAIDLIESLEKKYQYLLLLQPTAPVREPKDIENMIHYMKNNNAADASVSITRIYEPHPHKLKKISKEGYLESFLKGTSSENPRQNLAPVYALNGAMYLIKVDVLLKHKTFFPPKTLPYIMDSNFNIDEEEDLIFLKAMEKSDKIKIWGAD